MRKTKITVNHEDNIIVTFSTYQGVGQATGKAKDYYDLVEQAYMALPSRDYDLDCEASVAVVGGVHIVGYSSGHAPKTFNGMLTFCIC